MIETEVAVIGCGPAGVATSVVLARSGVRVMLLGPAPAAKLKVGESLPAAAGRLLRRLGVASLPSLLNQGEYLPCSANVSAWGTERWEYRDALSDPEGHGWHLLRHRFEAALFKHALSQGARHGAVEIDGLASDGRQYQLAGEGLQIRCRFLIDASGRKAWATRRLAGKPRRTGQQFAAVAWVREQADSQDNTTRIKSTRDGWWYSARLPDRLRVVAFHGLSGRIGHVIKAPDHFFKACNDSALLEHTLTRTDLIHGLQGCDAGAGCAEIAVGPRWLAVGDAALSFDPLSSQGLFFALYSGIRGGEAAMHCLQASHRQPTVLLKYQRQIKQIFERNERTRRLFYSREPRYRNEDYWRLQLAGLRCH